MSQSGGSGAHERRLRSQNSTSTDVTFLDEVESIPSHDSAGVNACSMVHSEVLYFIQNQQDAGVAHDDLCQIVLDFYDESELVQAKNLLLGMLPTSSKMIPACKTRIGSNKVRQVVQDILHLIQLPAFTNDVPRVLFVAAFASRVPPISFKHLDVSVLMSTIKTMQADLYDLKAKSVTSQDVHEIVEASLRSRVGVPQAARSEVGDSCPRVYSDAVKSGIEKQGEAAPRGPTPAATSATSSTSSSSAGVEHNHQQPTQQQKRLRRRQGNKTLVIGKATDHRGNLKVITRRVKLFVSRLDPATTAEEVEEYVKVEMGLEVAAEKRDTRYNTYASFLITCQATERSSLLEEGKWPSNTLVKPWYPPRPTKSEDRHNESSTQPNHTRSNHSESSSDDEHCDS